MSRRKRRARRFAQNPPRQEPVDSSSSASAETAEPTPDEASAEQAPGEADEAADEVSADDVVADELGEPEEASVESPDEASVESPDEATEEDTDSAAPARPWEPARAEDREAEPPGVEAPGPAPSRPEPPLAPDEAKPDRSVPSAYRPWGPQVTDGSPEPVPPQDFLAAADAPISTTAETPPESGTPVSQARRVTPVLPASVTGRAVGPVDFAAAERLAAEEAFSVDEEPEAAVEAAPLAPRTSTARIPEANVAAAVQAAVAALPGRSSIPGICPFLRSVAAIGLAPPLDAVDPDHRCAALAEPLSVSRPQQELLCLQPSHVSCPRYARGLMTIQDRIAPRPTNTRQLPIVAAAILLIIIAAAAGTIAVLRGGLGVPVGVVASPTPTASPSAAIVTPTPTGSPSPTASPTATPTRRPTPSPTRLPAAYATLDPCPQSDPHSPCFVYTVVEGDSLSTIADRYRTRVEEIRRLNPEIRDPDAISAGDRIRIPPPPG